ncbi:MAG: hypothetical protein J6T44_03415 [Prevotella sp.]|nr:hypothetical protein [Prevotella sp.]MBO7538313.1 hypothetical protein [Prevotella sp.]
MKKFFYLCIIVAVGFSLVSCGNKNPKNEEAVEQDPYYSSSMERSAADTAAIVQLATQYLDLLKENKITEAVDMLHEVDSVELKPLSNERKNTVINGLKKYPVLSYTIEEIKMFTDDNTELRYVYEFMPKPEGADNLPNTMKGLIGFFRLGETWYMTVPEDKVDPTINDMKNAEYSSDNN